MNLSNRLKMPAPSSGPTPFGNDTATALASASSTDTTGILGMGFAHIMAQQFGPMSTPLRQESAALVAPAATATPNSHPTFDPSLRSMDISPRVRIITDPRQTPNPESLITFAQSMGLDANTIGQLLGADPAPSQSALPTHNQALPSLSPSDLQSLTPVQIMVRPMAMTATTDAAVSTTAFPGNPPATVAVLSLLGGPLKEQDISTLASAFEPSEFGAGTERQKNEPRGTPTSDFFHPLSSANVTVNVTADPAVSTTAVVNRPMNEVYEQLSDKLITEIADRMNQKLSDGEWEMKFALRPAHLGSVDIQLELKDGTLQATLQADSPLTRDLLKHSSQRLRESLENFGTHAAQVHVGQEGGRSRQQRFQDTATASRLDHSVSLQRIDPDAPSSAQKASNTKRSASSLDLYV